MAKATKKSKTPKTEIPSREPFTRALERIEALVARGQDAREGTIRRLNATSDPDKIWGIQEAAIHMGWGDIALAAATKRSALE